MAVNKKRTGADLAQGAADGCCRELMMASSLAEILLQLVVLQNVAPVKVVDSCGQASCRDAQYLAATDVLGGYVVVSNAGGVLFQKS